MLNITFSFVFSGSGGRRRRSALGQQQYRAACSSNKRRRRVAPLLVVSAHADGEWKSDHARGGSYGGAAKAAESGDRTVGKARWGVGHTHRGVVARRAAAVQRLSAIAEAASE